MRVPTRTRGPALLHVLEDVAPSAVHRHAMSHTAGCGEYVDGFDEPPPPRRWPHPPTSPTSELPDPWFVDLRS